jgi:diguanylate cyclase (GGDEF)-like protein
VVSLFTNVRRLIFAALGATALAYAGVTGFGLGPAWLSDVLYYGLTTAAALVCLARVIAVPRDRLPWGLMAFGLVAWMAAEYLWLLRYASLEAPPYPSLADAGWLAFYPASYAAVVLLVMRRGMRPPLGVWLDGVIAALAAAAVAAALLFGPILATSVEGTPAAIATNLAYPVGDLLLVGLVVAVLGLGGWRLDRLWIVLGLGLILNGIADSWYLARYAQGTYVDGELLDSLWPAASLLVAWAAWQPRSAPSDALALAGRRHVVLPIASALVGLALLVYDHFHRINSVALLLAAATLAVAVVRMGLVFRANARLLAASRSEALTDALTGLGNRRSLMADLDESMRAGSADTLVLFDLDGFKRYNDTFGHPAGDALLQRLGRKLSAAVEGGGSAYRMGGDEFCVLLHERDGFAEAAAAALSEQGQGFAIAASRGAVVPAVEAATATEALQIADQRMYGHKASRSAARSSETRDVLMRILQERQPALHEHLASVASLARAVGTRLGLMPQALEELARAAELHDVGKMAIPDAILNKPGPLDDEEWAFMRRHTLIGEGILSAAPALVPVAKLVRSSHERWDGAGYPDRLAGEAIPLGARIVAVCDAYDAMTEDRAYRKAMSQEAALAELRASAGTQFDADVVEAFCEALIEAPAAPRLARAA